MIIDSYDNITEPIVKLEHFYGEKRHLADICLVLLSHEIHKAVLEQYTCTKVAEIPMSNGITPVYTFEHEGQKLAFYLSPIGSAMAGHFTAEANWLTGAEKFIMFGSAGSLDADKTNGRFIIPTEAYRDEGMSYHYAPPSDYIPVKNHAKVAEIFASLNIPYTEGRVWTTDAFLMETVGQTAKRRGEGCIAVEMELAGVQAVCDHYGFELYDFLAAGDVLSEELYEPEGLPDANHNLDKFYIALEIAKRI